MNRTPWLTPKKRKLVNLLLKSHHKAFGCSLIKCQKVDDLHRLESQELFISQMPVLAHSKSSDPLITYANSSALLLWGRQWQEMINMPSRLTAPTDARQQRYTSLQCALEQNAVTGYKGVRIDNDGKLFIINNARIWTLWDEEGEYCGQAASFNNWCYV